MKNTHQNGLFDKQNDLPIALALGISIAVFGIVLLFSSDTRSGGIFFAVLGSLTAIGTAIYARWKHYQINWSKFWMVVVLIIIGPGFILCGLSIMRTNEPMAGFLGWMQASFGMLITSCTLVFQKKNPILMVIGYFLFIIAFIMFALLGATPQ